MKTDTLADQLEIGPAAAADIPALCELLTVLFSQEREFQPNRKAQKRGLGLILEQPETGQIWVARLNGEIVGMVNVLYTVSTALGERVAWLEDMVVAPAHRACGIGSALLSHTVAQARRQGCRRITLLTDADNAAGQRFYVKHGFSASAMRPMRLPLND